MRVVSLLGMLGVLCLAAASAMAGEQTATLKVEGMTCASCPYQVKKSLTRVEGVKAADVSLDSRIATVVFDDEKTNVAALTEATTSAGFPSKPVD